MKMKTYLVLLTTMALPGCSAYDMQQASLALSQLAVAASPPAPVYRQADIQDLPFDPEFESYDEYRERTSYRRRPSVDYSGYKETQPACVRSC